MYYYVIVLRLDDKENHQMTIQVKKSKEKVTYL